MLQNTPHHELQKEGAFSGALGSGACGVRCCGLAQHNEHYYSYYTALWVPWVTVYSHCAVRADGSAALNVAGSALGALLAGAGGSGPHIQAVLAPACNMSGLEVSFGCMRMVLLVLLASAAAPACTARL